MKQQELVLGIDHVRFYVGNAFMSADFFCSKFGFVPYAYDGFKTGNRDLCTHVVKQQDIVLAFTSGLSSSPNEKTDEFYKSLQKHGDNHVRDVAFQVASVSKAFDRAVQMGAKVIQRPIRYYRKKEMNDYHSEWDSIVVEEENGKDETEEYIEMAVVQPPFAGWVHTLIERNYNRNDVFFPKYKLLQEQKKERNMVQRIDHVACAIEKDSLHVVTQWYNNAFGFSRFFSNDDDNSDTGISIESSDQKAVVGLRTMTFTPNQNDPNSFKFVFVEPVNTNTSRSQIQEFLDYHGSTGIAHLALSTNDIISCVQFTREHSIPYISVPHNYYSKWRTEKAPMYKLVKEDWSLLQELSILCDGKLYNEGNSKRFEYLLQTFTLPLQDKPTFYLELICRRGANGFGNGNIKSLFDAIEEQQKERGNFEIRTRNE